MAITVPSQLPASMKAVVIHGPGQGKVETVPVPKAGPGSVTIRVLHSIIHNNAYSIYHGNMSIDLPKYPTPYIFGGYGVGRIAGVGPDTTAFQPGQLVIFEPWIRARDDPSVAILSGGVFHGMDEKTQNFTRQNWLDGCWSEYFHAPLENTWAVDEAKIAALGLSTPELTYIGPLAVCYAGLRKIDVKAGETVVVAPATGVFSGGTIAVARAMGVNVVAASRNAEGLSQLAASFPGVKTVQLTGGPEDTAALQAHGPIDAFVDVSPPQATDHPSLRFCMLSLRRDGRVCLMGGRNDNALPYPYLPMVLNDLTIRGSWMFENDHITGLIKMVENGVLRLDKEHGGLEVMRSYKLEDFEQGIEAGRNCAAGKIYIISPDTSF